MNDTLPHLGDQGTFPNKLNPALAVSILTLVIRSTRSLCVTNEPSSVLRTLVAQYLPDQLSSVLSLTKRGPVQGVLGVR